MDEYPDLYNIYKPPGTMHPQNDDTRAKDLGRLNPDTCVRAYQKAWDPGHHLAGADDDFRDAIWSVSEGKRDVRK